MLNFLFSFKDIFAKEGTFPPAGMFSLEHIIFLIIMILIIIASLYFSRNFKKNHVKIVTIIMGFTFLSLEIIKICYKLFVNGDKVSNLDAWLPLYYCSLFIYATLFSFTKYKYINLLNRSFIAGGAFTGGLAFLIFPSTSFSIVPAYHFLSIHSMLYHSSMVYLSIMFLKTNLFECTFKNFKYYLSYVLFFMAIALVLNACLDTNLMMLSKPFNLPIPIINNIYDFSPFIFTLCSILVYLIFPYLFSFGIYKIFHHKKEVKPLTN